MEVRKYCKDILDDVIEIRRKIHMYPEVDMECKNTLDLICEELDKNNVEYQRFDNSGLIANIKGSKAKSDNIIMLRADMDALNIKEETGFEFSSKNEGRMHACGHDLHTAMLLGSARILNSIKDEFAGTVRLLFQCGEETSNGASFLIEKGALDGVKMGFGMHMDPLAKTHQISARRGADWAAVDHFEIKVKGKGGHGALPHKTADALICACSIALNLQTIVSRNANPIHPLVITIGQLHSGTAYNIISEEAYLEGTCRCFDQDIYELIPEAMNRVCLDTAKALNCEAEFKLDRQCKALINDDNAYDLMRKSADKILFNKEDFFECDQAMIGEDFAEYASRIPCIFTHLGADGGYALHNCHINFNEESMETGMALQVQFALDALNELE